MEDMDAWRLAECVALFDNLHYRYNFAFYGQRALHLLHLVL